MSDGKMKIKARKDGDDMEYLVETALLTHGLKSISNTDILDKWTIQKKNIVWVSQGEIKIGDMEEYLFFREHADRIIRLNCETLEEAMENRISGALTASGTMEVCRRNGIPVAVTCGMGGISKIKEEKLCSDLPALVNLPVILISTGPKDMMARGKTVQWLIDHGVKVVGAKRGFCTGYIFEGDKVLLQGEMQKPYVPPLLIIQEIPEQKRVKDREILAKAIREGKKAESAGQYFHPAVNGKIDELTEGYSSVIQLKSLLENAKLAEWL